MKLTAVLPRYQVFLKIIIVPPGNYAEIKNILKYEAERYIPFPADSCIIDFFPVKPLNEHKSNEICLIAVKKETIAKHLQFFKNAGLVPEAITVSSLIINDLVNLNIKDDSVAFIKIDTASWEINIFSHGQLVISRGFGISPDDNDYLDTIVNEINNSFNMFYSSAKHSKIDKIYYLTSNVDIVNRLKNTLKMPLIDFNSEYRFTLARQTINLLPEELKQSISDTKQNKRRLIAAIALTVSLALLFSFIFGIKYYKSSENRKISKMVESNKKEILELARIQNHLEAINHFKKNNTLSLEILKEISQNLPSGVYIRQLGYDNNENTVLIRCRAGSYGIASKAVSQLSKSKYFAQVSNKGSYATKIGDKDLVDFEITCGLKREISK